MKYIFLLMGLLIGWQGLGYAQTFNNTYTKEEKACVTNATHYLRNSGYEDSSLNFQILTEAEKGNYQDIEGFVIITTHTETPSTAKPPSKGGHPVKSIPSIQNKTRKSTSKSSKDRVVKRYFRCIYNNDKVTFHFIHK